MVLSNLPAGDYALGVFSQGTLGIHTNFNWMPPILLILMKPYLFR
jgi:hypothetical protein